MPAAAPPPPIAPAPAPLLLRSRLPVNFGLDELSDEYDGAAMGPAIAAVEDEETMVVV